MICLAQLKRNGTTLSSLLLSRSPVLASTSYLTTLLHTWNRIGSGVSSTFDSRSYVPCGRISCVRLRYLSTASTGGKVSKKKKKESIILFKEKRNKSAFYLAFFTCFPLALGVSGVLPHYVELVNNAYSSFSLGYAFSMAVPSGVLCGLYTLAVLWGLRFPWRVELTRDMMLKMHIVKWPGYKSYITLDPSVMKVQRENEKLYSIAKPDLYVNYTLNKKWGTIERRDILDRLFGKYDDQKKDKTKRMKD